jgi:hypothetical protein
MIKEGDKDLARNICPNCHVALLCQHDESHLWLKCELCAFCILKTDNKKRYV